MQVTFYNFAKKINSTARPSGGVSYECYLKDNCSQLSPQIVLQNFLNAPHFNYCYIPEFSRYYYVSNITWESGDIWVFDLAVDVLASYRHLIAENNLYCTRTSNPTYYDRNIIDTLYPATVEKQVNHRGILTPFLKENLLTSGTYVLGIVGKSGQMGGVKYYAFTYDELLFLVHYAFDATTYSWNPEEITDSLAQSIVNPFQYVVSSYFYPFRISGGTRTKKVDFGWWSLESTSADIATVLPDSGYQIFSLTDETPLRHPQTNTIGMWLNSSPYSRMSLQFEPFGIIALDPMNFVLDNYLTMDLIVDLITGDGTLYIGNDPETSASDEPLLEVRAKIGVPIQLSAYTRDIVGSATSVLNSISAAVTGNVVGAAVGVGNAVASLLPQMQTGGSNGSLATYYVSATLIQEFMPVKQIDVDHKGKPSCINLRLASIAGGGYNHFYQFEDGDIAISVTASELQEIKSFLENGIFYEE